TYKLTLLAILASLAVVGRYILAFIPNVQPVTAIIIISGVIIGRGAAIILAFLVTFLCNMLVGMGVWTIWQITSWWLMWFIAGIVCQVRRRVPVFVLIIYGFFS